MESNLKSDETIVFFQTAAWMDQERKFWYVPIHGWVYEPQNSRVRSKLFAKLLEKKYGLSLGAGNRSNFQQRTNLLIADNERGKKIVIEIGDKKFMLPASRENGHFLSALKIPARDVSRLASGRVLTYRAVTGKHDQREFLGHVNLIDPEGISVISDIDDTIKISQVGNHRDLFDNTFFKDFKAVAGMPQLYRQWSDAGVFIHFVSSSPWQLYSPLLEFTRQAGFPPATFSLKSLRFRDETLFDLFKQGTETKPAQIEPFFRAYPNRKFILIGDSGEQDPEVYAGLMKKFPAQVVRIYIRSINGVSQDRQRLEKLFDGIAPHRWNLFTDPGELKLPVLN